MQDHGGDLDRARALHGAGDWLDLSTGINPVAYRLAPFEARALAALPTAAETAALEAAAARAYVAGGSVVALAGAQAAIQLVPRLSAPGRARVLAPSYAEHARALRAQGWAVEETPETEAMAGADLAVVANPNNPDGRRWAPEALLRLARSVGRLVVDESFADAEPALSLASATGPAAPGLLVMRSFGKFYGLAGLRLGFALCDASAARTLRGLAGPWAVSGPAIAAGCAALADDAWRAATAARLARDADRLDAMAAAAGWRAVGGAALFRTFDAGDGEAAQARLARKRVWTRVFRHPPGWIRLGLPGTEDGWRRLAEALAREP